MEIDMSYVEHISIIVLFNTNEKMTANDIQKTLGLSFLLKLEEIYYH